MYMHLLYPYISERIHKVFGKVPAAPSRPPVFGYKKGEWAREKEGNGRGKGDKGEWVREKQRKWKRGEGKLEMGEGRGKRRGMAEGRGKSGGMGEGRGKS